MDHRRYLAALAAQLERFAALVAGADPGTPVPTCPGWDLAELRWVAATAL